MPESLRFTAPPWPPQDPAILAALTQAFADGSWGKYDGGNVAQLVASLCELHQVAHAFPCSSGTIAVELALRGLKVGDGDEVILAGYDFPGNFRCVEAVGARPVLADLESRGWSLDSNQLAAAWSPAVKAILVSHLHGSLADMRTITQFAQDRKLKVIEDACQSPGALVQGKMAGTWGDCGILSFGGSKLLTAGRGGAVITPHAEVLQRIKIFADRGNLAFPLAELQAAVLLPQLPKLAVFNQQRWASVQRLLEQLEEAKSLTPPTFRPGDTPSFYKLGWLLGSSSQNENFSCDERMRQAFLTPLQAQGIAIDSGFRGFTRRSSTRCRVVGELPNARQAAAGTVILHHPLLLSDASVMAQLAHAIAAVVS